MGTPSAGPILPGAPWWDTSPLLSPAKCHLENKRPHASAAYLKKPLALIYGTVQM